MMQQSKKSDKEKADWKYVDNNARSFHIIRQPINRSEYKRVCNWPAIDRLRYLGWQVRRQYMLKSNAATFNEIFCADRLKQLVAFQLKKMQVEKDLDTYSHQNDYARDVFPFNESFKTWLAEWGMLQDNLGFYLQRTHAKYKKKNLIFTK